MSLTVTPDGWTNDRCLIEDRENRVSVITGNETNTTKYPNTKAVYDFIKALADANNLTMP
jgi:hypothetical protein